GDLISCKQVIQGNSSGNLSALRINFDDIKSFKNVCINLPVYIFQFVQVTNISPMIGYSNGIEYTKISRVNKIQVCTAITDDKILSIIRNAPSFIRPIHCFNRLGNVIQGIHINNVALPGELVKGVVQDG